MSKSTADSTYATKDTASASANGLMSSADYTKLSGIEEGAETNVDSYGIVDVDGLAMHAYSAKSTLKLISGTNVTLTASNGSGNKKITFSASYPNASSSNAGLLTASLYSKLNALPTSSTLESTYAKKTDIANAYIFKGTVAAESALPTSGQNTGDVYNITASSSYGGAGTNVAWDGTAWDALGTGFDVSAITNAQIDKICE